MPTYLTLQEAAFISRKSPQTIRRLIKSHKVKSKKQRTPQGFHYYVSKESLMDYFDLMPRVLPDESSTIPPDNQPPQKPEQAPAQKEEQKTDPENQTGDMPFYRLGDTHENVSEPAEKEPLTGTVEEKKEEEQPKEPPQQTLQINHFTEQLTQLTQGMHKLIAQHAEDKKQMYGMINTYQTRIKELEEQVKMLSAPKKKWYQFWK